MDSLHASLGLLSADSRQTLPKMGALIPEMKRCGKGNCRCAAGALHGPYYYRYYREGGRLRKRYVRPAEVEAVRAGIEERRRMDQERRQAQCQLKYLMGMLRREGLW